MEVLGRLLALLAILLAGTGLRATGALDERRTERLNALAYYVALPALIFVSTYDRSVADLLTPTLLAGLLVVLTATAGLAWAIHRNRSSRPRRSVAVVQSYHSNLGYLGLPLVAATFDAEVTAVASVILGVLSLAQVPLTVVVLSTVNGADASLGRELAGLARNPVLATLVAGLLVGSAGLAVPAPVATGLDAVGSLALPLALVCVGASLRIDLPGVDLGATGSVVALKIGAMPALAWAVFSVLGVDTATFTASVVMLGTPTAVSTFVFASELGGDAEFASLNVFATTLASIGTLFVLISLVG
ncbi:AEC family transporter [Halorussus salilacus]|uniref:AEC family transporter n=1 Tax=Halorussus salilacus TaxID=2953750 RepID=UPI00209D4439|nr:AEC family transporter [Halorussus salilacus]USZ67524.1 AEC family transporter [Halorussus salilacus]